MNASVIMSVIDIAIGIGVILIALDVLFLVVALFVDMPLVRRFMRRGVFLFAFIVALAASLLTLYYSEVVGVLPCTLCWYQRLVMYPLTLVLAYGYLKKDTRILPWAAGLSSLGLGIALYHLSLPLWTNPIFCDAETALCLVQQVKVFGFITIPMMSAVAFAYLTLLSVHGYRSRGKTSDEMLSAVSPEEGKTLRGILS